MVLRRPAGVGDGVGCGRWAKRPPLPTILCDRWGRLRLGLYTLLPAMVGGERINERGILNSNNTMVLDTALVNEHGDYLSCGRADVVVRSSVRPCVLRQTTGNVWCSSSRSGHLRVLRHVDSLTTLGVGDQYTLADHGAAPSEFQSKSRRGKIKSIHSIIHSPPFNSLHLLFQSAFHWPIPHRLFALVCRATHRILKQ